MVTGNGRLFWISMRGRVVNCVSIFNQTNHNGGLILAHFDSLSFWFGGRRGGQRAERGLSDTTSPRFRCGHRPAAQMGGADC